MHACTLAQTRCPLRPLVHRIGVAKQGRTRKILIYMSMSKAQDWSSSCQCGWSVGQLLIVRSYKGHLGKNLRPLSARQSQAHPKDDSLKWSSGKCQYQKCKYYMGNMACQPEERSTGKEGVSRVLRRIIDNNKSIMTSTVIEEWAQGREKDKRR